MVDRARIGRIEQDRNGDNHVDPVARLELGDGRERLPVRPGHYVLELLARWPKGDGYFRFGISVIPRRRKA